MPISELHFIREILMTDFRRKQVPIVQASEAGILSLRPIYKGVAFYDVDAVRTLYHKLGGLPR